MVKFEAGISSWWFLFPLCYGVQGWSMVSRASWDNFMVLQTGMIVTVIMAYGHFFKDLYRIQRPLEFPFTRAISRGAVFGSKTTLFLLSVALIFLPGIFYGLWLYGQKRLSLEGRLEELVLFGSSALLFAAWHVAFSIGITKFRWKDLVGLGAFAGGVFLFPLGIFPWARSHEALFFCILAVLFGLALRIGYRKFVTQEVIE